MKHFLKKLVLWTVVLVLTAGRGLSEVTALDPYTGDVFDLHIDTNGSNNEGGGVGIYECHYLEELVTLVNDEIWDLTEGADAQDIVDYYNENNPCADPDHDPIVPEDVPGMYFTGFIIYHVTYWNGGAKDGDLKFVGIQASYSNVAPNVAPVANDQAVSTPEDTAKDITLTGSDANGDPLTYTVLTQPTHGTLSGTGPNVHYVPAADYFGLDSFTFSVNDGHVDSNIATVTITVGSINDAPVADSQTVTTPEDTGIDITLTGSDLELSPLTFIKLTDPASGVLTGSGTSYHFEPAHNFYGQLTFTFKVNDGISDSNVATVTINVTAVNDGPTAFDQTLSTPEDTGLNITLTGSDPESDPLTFIKLSNPASGVLTGSGSSYHFQPALDFFGQVTFTFKVNDGDLDSDVAVITINVGTVNDAPTAFGQSLSTPEDVDLDITLAGLDPDGDPLTYHVLSLPEHGSLVGTGSDVTYVPNPNYYGSDSFTFKVNDGTVDSNIATITITVRGVNDGPSAFDQTLSTPEDTGLNITLTGSDPESDPLTFFKLSDPASGVLTGSGSSYHFQPALDFFGQVTFTFRTYDGNLYSNVAVITINVGTVNDAPTAFGQTLSTPEDVDLDITLAGLDPDGDPLTYHVLSLPEHGSLVGTAPDLTYVPNPNYYGSDSFTFKVNDGTVDSNIATITITVRGVNDAPIADDQSLSTPEDTGLDITLTGSDPESDPLTFIKLSDPASGVLTGSGSSYHFQPALDFFGQVTFTFKVNDGELNSPIATITITVNSVNDIPTAFGQTLTTPEDVDLDITLAGLDPDGDPLTYTILTLPEHGTLEGTAPDLTYVPNPNYNGPDSFTFKVDDGTEDSNIATIDINVSSVNDAPVADDQSLSTAEDTGLDITLTGSDLENDPLSFIVVSGPSYGSLTGTGADLHYEPNLNYFGPDSFTFKVNDGDLDSPEATVTIIVTPVNDAPVADDASFSVDEGGQYLGHVWAHDVDPHAVPLLFVPNIFISFLDYSVVVWPQYGSLVFNLDGSYTYTHNGSENPTDFFTFKANDGQLDSNVARVDITVNPINDAPIAYPDDFAVFLGGLHEGSLIASDAENDALSWIIVDAPLYGSLVLNPDGTYDYQHNGDNALADSFTYKVNDGSVDSNVATVSITVTVLPIVNTPPGTLPEAITLDEGSSLTDAVGGYDADGDPISFVLVSDVVNGTLTFNANGTYTYIHNGTETIADSFQFRSYDGKATSTVRTAFITINPINDAPVAVNGEDETDFNTVLTGNIHDLISDVDSANWTLGLVGSVAHGTLVLNANGTFTYTPNTDFSGEDSFTFKANDGGLDSNIATYTITVNEEVIIDDPDTPLNPLNYWWVFLLGLLFILIFFLRPNLKYALVDKNGKETTIRRHIFANGKDDLFIDIDDKNIEGLVKVDLVLYKQLVKREQGQKITFNLFKKPVRTIVIPEDMKDAIEDQIKL